MAIWSSGLGSPGFVRKRAFQICEMLVSRTVHMGLKGRCIEGFRRFIVFSMGPYSC